MKKCSTCLIEKATTEFHANKKHSDGLQYHCKSCAVEISKNRWQKMLSSGTTKTEDYRKNSWAKVIKHRYGITEAEYQKNFADQAGCCAICGAHQDTLKHRLYVDHCHKSKKLRGLLCFKCNAALGYFNDNVGRIKKALSYLGEAT